MPFKKGQPGWNSGRKFPKNKYPNYGMRGKKHSKETLERLSLIHKGKKYGKKHRKNISLAKLKELNPNWKYGRIKLRTGYIYILSPGHPAAVNKGRNNRGYVAEHRLVMEKYLGRYLNSKEYIHHRNGIKDDNRFDNLEIILVGKTHKGKVNCPFCKKEFSIR